MTRVFTTILLHSRSPVKKMFRFQSGDADSPVAGAPLESPYVVSPVGRDAPLGSPLASPKRAQRKISRSPFKARPPPTLPPHSHGNSMALVRWSACAHHAVQCAACKGRPAQGCSIRWQCRKAA